MSAPQTTVDQTARDELAKFTIFSAANGKVYACGVPLDVAASWTAPYGGRPEDLLALELCD